MVFKEMCDHVPVNQHSVHTAIISPQDAHSNATLFSTHSPTGTQQKADAEWRERGRGLSHYPDRQKKVSCSVDLPSADC